MATSAIPLSTWDDDALATLLRRRPDLAAPAPGSLPALATRAATARSLQLAVTGLDTPHLALLDAVLALSVLGGAGSAVEENGGTGATGVTATTLARATGLPSPAPLLQDLSALALLQRSGARWLPVPGLLTVRPQPARLAVSVPATSQEPVAVPDSLSPAAARVLDALTWTSPVGTLAEGTSSPVTTAAAELLAHGLVRSTADGSVVLPGATALALRDGRTHRDATVTPPTVPAPVIDTAVLAAESARAALALVHQLDDLDRLWARSPAGALRSGGIGVREVRRTAAALGVEEGVVVLLAELAAAAGEIATTHDSDGAIWAPTRAHTASGRVPRWAALARAWARSDRAFALVGSRADDGALRAALEGGLERGWAAPLRHRVLRALQAWPLGSAPDEDAVLAHVAWHTPASPPPRWAVRGVLAEAATLGVTGAGALSAAGRALLADLVGGPGADDVDEANAADGSAGPSGDGGSAGPLAPLVHDHEEVDHVCAALEADLPPAVADVLVQADLTAIVPGRPAPEVEEVLLAAGEVESRGSALTVRFTPASLARAIGAGWRSEELLEALRRHSRTPLPQALEYAVREAERRDGGLRTGAAGSYLRSEEPAVLATLLDLPGLDLRLLAPTVAVSSLSAARVAAVLRESGRSIGIEGPDGVVVAPDDAVTLAPLPRRHAPSTTTLTPDPYAVVRALREAQARPDPVTEPASVVATLQAAATSRTPLWVTVVGPSGASDRRRITALRIQGGHVVARDLERESDLTIALHRIADARPVG